MSRKETESNAPREVLRVQRKKRGLTQAQVATAIGLARCSYNLIENGKRNLSLENAKKLSEVFQLDIQHLV
jgi:putative transcriptional regulator